MLASLAVGRSTAAVADCLQSPYQRVVRNPVVYCHGTGGDATQAQGVVVPALVPILRALTDVGYTVGTPSCGDTFGNATGRSRVTDAVTFARANGAHASKKVILVGISMGGTQSLSWANANPTLVAAVILIEPALDLQAMRVADTLGTRSIIDAAWGVTYPTALPAGASPMDYAAALAAIPIWMATASDDAVSVNYATFNSSHGTVDWRNLGALGHGNTAVAAVDIPTVVAFAQAHAG